MKILIIDDNERLSQRIKQRLGRQYLIDTVSSGQQGILQADMVDYGLIILDLGLPDIPGAQVCKQLRERQNAAPILILSAEYQVDTKVDLLNAGADDFMVKPFDINELNSRISAILRRTPKIKDHDVLRVGDLELDCAGRQVRRNGTIVDLRRKEFDILEYLVMNRNRAVSRAMIFDHAWEDGDISWHNTVDVHIKHLRDKVDKPFGQANIKTAYGVGYLYEVKEA